MVLPRFILACEGADASSAEAEDSGSSPRWRVSALCYSVMVVAVAGRLPWAVPASRMVSPSSTIASSTARTNTLRVVDVRSAAMLMLNAAGRVGAVFTLRRHSRARHRDLDVFSCRASDECGRDGDVSRASFPDLRVARGQRHAGHFVACVGDAHRDIGCGDVAGLVVAPADTIRDRCESIGDIRVGGGTDRECLLGAAVGWWGSSRSMGSPSRRWRR